MATFSASGIPDPTPNVLFDPAKVDAAVQARQAGALDLQSKQLANQYTAAVQPAQINLLLSGLNGLSGAPAAPSAPNALTDPASGQAGSQQATPVAASNQAADPNSRIPAPADGQMSLFHGTMPISADPGTQALVGDIAQQNGVNPEWGMRIQNAESGSFKNAQSAVSPAGALGTMQLMPGTAQGLGVDPGDVRQNITGGVKYLAQLKQQYGSPVLATAAYNAGPGRVDAFLSGKAALPTETVNYVGKVFGTDGPSLLNDALSGFHGPTPGHADGVGTTSFGQPGAGLQPVQQDETAKASVRQLLALRQVSLAQPGGAGMRAVGQIQAQLDNIAGPGGIVANDGSVYRVPGTFATRYAAAQATEAGKSGPAAALYAANEGVRQAGDQQTAAVKSALDIQKAGQTPTKLSPGETLTTPSAVGVGPGAIPTAPVAPAMGQPIPLPPGATSAVNPGDGSPIMYGGQPLPNGQVPRVNLPPGVGHPRPGDMITVGKTVPDAPALGSGGNPMDPTTAAAPAQQPSGIYQAPVNPAIADATEGAKQRAATYDDVIKTATESASSLNRIGQIRAALANTTAAGLPPGALAEPLSKGIAIAKYLGVDPKQAFGVDPSAVPNEQVAREGLTQLTGLLLKQIFPGRITDTDVRTYGQNFGNIAQDPAALNAILNQAQQVAQYGVDRGHDMLGYRAAHNDSMLGWDHQWYGQHGFAPDLADALSAKTAPAGPAAPNSPAGAASAPTVAPTPSASSIDHLRQNPGLAPIFDRRYGQGASARVLGQ